MRTHRNPGWQAAERERNPVTRKSRILQKLCWLQFALPPETSYKNNKKLYTNHKCGLGYELENNREDKSSFYFVSFCSFHAKLLPPRRVQVKHTSCNLLHNAHSPEPKGGNITYSSCMCSPPLSPSEIYINGDNYLRLFHKHHKAAPQNPQKELRHYF